MIMYYPMNKYVAALFGLVGLGMLLILIPDGDCLAEENKEAAGRVLEQAWKDYNRGDLAAAQAGFEKAAGMESDDDSSQALLGLGYVLMKTGQRQHATGVFRKLVDAGYRPDEVLPVLLDLMFEQKMFEEAGTYAEKLPAAERKNWQSKIHQQLGSLLYEQGKLEEARKHLDIALENDPQNHAAASLYGWTLFRLGDYETADRFFAKDFAENRSPASADGMLLGYERNGTDRQRADFLHQLSLEEDPKLRGVAAKWYFNNGFPILASQVSQEKADCYRGYDSLWISFSPDYRNKRGDEGLSRLNLIRMPMELTVPMAGGRAWGIEMIPLYLDSGEAPDLPYAGSFFNKDNVTAQRSLIDSRWALQPSLFLYQEGIPAWSLRVGTTTVSGPLSPRVTFDARFFSVNRWHIEMHQQSVQESILSTVGLEDPYSDKEWGRVLKTGLSAGRTFLLSSPFWLSLEGGLDYYWGKNIVQNRAWSQSLSLGRTDPFYAGHISWGIFASARQFQENSDFFTLGHGGYFSPQNFLITGPFVRYRTRGCSQYRVDISGSLGYMNYDTDSSRKYPEQDVPDSWNNSWVREEFFSYHPGQDKNGIGGTVKLELERLLTPHLSTGFRASFSSSSGYDEWAAGLFLTWSWANRSSLLQ